MTESLKSLADDIVDVRKKEDLEIDITKFLKNQSQKQVLIYKEPTMGTLARMEKKIGTIKKGFADYSDFSETVLNTITLLVLCHKFPVIDTDNPIKFYLDIYEKNPRLFQKISDDFTQKYNYVFDLLSDEESEDEKKSGV